MKLAASVTIAQRQSVKSVFEELSDVNAPAAIHDKHSVVQCQQVRVLIVLQRQIQNHKLSLRDV